MVIWCGWPCCWIQKLVIRSHWGGCMAFLFFWLEAHACRVCNEFLTVNKTKLKTDIESVIHWLDSLCPTVENKLDTALQCPWYSAQMCHLPWGHAERVGSMYNDPKERHLGENNEKNGLWMLRGLCSNDWCCLREGFRQILGCNTGEIKRRRRRRRREWRGKLFLGSSWSHLSVWLKYDSAEIFHRQTFRLNKKKKTLQEGSICVSSEKTWDQVILGLWLYGTTFHSS